MARIFMGEVNFMNYFGATKILVKNNYKIENYLFEFSLEGSNNIYFSWIKSRHDCDYLISTEKKDNFYMNSTLTGLCRELTSLKQTDLLNTSKVNYFYVNNMHTTFANCFSLKESPISPRIVQSMYGTYYNCTNLIGQAASNRIVNNMIGTYYNCTNITGTPICNDNVMFMKGTYYNCYQMTGQPIVGPNVISIEDCYYNCGGLQGSPADCNNVIIAINAYYNCQNLYGAFNWYEVNFNIASRINATNMFYGRNYSNELCIYVRDNSSVMNALLNYSHKYGNIYGVGTIDWTQSGDYYYNSLYNTKIYIQE